MSLYRPESILVYVSPCLTRLIAHAPSQVTDARATMAVYRLHRKEWERKEFKHEAKTGGSGKKRKRHKNNDVKSPEAHSDDESGGERVRDVFPGGGLKGVSSGLSTVVRRGSNSWNREPRSSGNTGEKKNKWWKELASRSKETLGFRTEPC